MKATEIRDAQRSENVNESDSLSNTNTAALSLEESLSQVCSHCLKKSQKIEELIKGSEGVPFVLDIQRMLTLKAYAVEQSIDEVLKELLTPEEWTLFSEKLKEEEEQQREGERQRLEALAKGEAERLRQKRVEEFLLGRKVLCKYEYTLFSRNGEDLEEELEIGRVKFDFKEGAMLTATQTEEEKAYIDEETGEKGSAFHICTIPKALTDSFLKGEPYCFKPSYTKHTATYILQV